MSEIEAPRENVLFGSSIAILSQLAFRAILVEILGLNAEGSDRLILTGIVIVHLAIIARWIILTSRGVPAVSLVLRTANRHPVLILGLWACSAVLGSAYSIWLAKEGNATLGAIGLVGGITMAIICVRSLLEARANPNHPEPGSA